MRATGRQSGFTLVELLLTLAVVVVLTGLAIPAMGNLLQRSGVVASSNSLVAALRQARQSAVYSNAGRLLCPSTDGLHCSAAPDWQQGWLIGQDRDRDGQPDATPSAVGYAMPQTVRVIGSRARVHIRFRADGSSPGSNLTLLVCQRGKARGARRVVLANSGRVRTVKATPKQAAACRHP